MNQTWFSSANRLAQWLFDGNYRDQMNTYNATPTNTMSFATTGYLNQALQFASNGNVMLNIPYIPLSSTSFTIDVWLYVTGLVNINDNAIFGYCYQTVMYKCLHLTFRLSGSNYHLYFGFFHADCEGVTSIILNTWMHVAFVFDMTTLTQRIYLNGVLENSCTQSSAVTASPTGITIGFLPSFVSVAYFQGYMDQMTVSNRAKSACEVLEVATLVGLFTFDTGSFLIDSGPNSLAAATRSTSSISSGRYAQAIAFNGSNSSYYQISGFLSLGVSSKPFSISLWVRPSILLGVVVHVSAWSSGSGWCIPFLGFSSNGSLLAQVYDGTGSVSVSNGNLSLSTSVWSHVVQTYSATNGLRLYVNNVLVGSQSTTYIVTSAPLYVTLGNALSGAGACILGQVNRSPYKGDIDDFRVYSRELSANDVFILYTN